MMKYSKVISLKDGRKCVIRNGIKEDAEGALNNFILTHGETDWLFSYPDEISLTSEKEALYLEGKTNSSDEIELIAEVGGKIVGLAGIDRIGKQDKVRHRCEMGVSIEKAYWDLGIGRAMTEALIGCAREAGYTQLELGVVNGNTVAIELYKSLGFTEYGRNKRGFRSRYTGYQEIILMSLMLD